MHTRGTFLRFQFNVQGRSCSSFVTIECPASSSCVVRESIQYVSYVCACDALCCQGVSRPQYLFFDVLINMLMPGAPGLSSLLGYMYLFRGGGGDFFRVRPACVRLLHALSENPPLRAILSIQLIQARSTL